MNPKFRNMRRALLIPMPFLAPRHANTQKIVTFTIFLLLSATVISSYSPIMKAEESKMNGLTIALDTLRSSDTAEVLVAFMNKWHYNSLRIYMGWCSSFWTGDVNNPMNTRTQSLIDKLCQLCAQNSFTVVCAVSAQVTPFRTAYPQEIQVGPNGERNSQGNWGCPSGPNFRTFTKNLIKTSIGIMEKYATPRISVDEIVFVTGSGKPTFYSGAMRTAYREATGKSIPLFSSTYGSYNTEQKQFIEFAKSTIREFFQIMENTAKAENPSVLFSALVDTYWVYPKTSDDTQPYDYYATVDEIVYEWFYATQNRNWAGITDGLKRIKNLNPYAKYYFIYGTSTMTSIANMRKAVELVMAEDYDGVFLYEYAKSRSSPFDVSDLVLSTTPTPEPPPPQTQYGTLKFNAWDGENWIVGAILTIRFPNGTVKTGMTPYDNSQAPTGSYTVRCSYSEQEANDSPYEFTLGSNEIESHTFVIGETSPPAAAYIFEDNFDSADFSKWTGVRTSYGEVAKVVDSLAGESGYYVQFASNGRSDSEYAYCYKTVNMEEVWASGYFFISSGLPLDNSGDRVYFIRFISGQDAVASVGIGRRYTSNNWVLYGIDGLDSIGPVRSSSPAVQMNCWYRIELHWKNHPTLGSIDAYLNGQKVLSLNDIDTSKLGNVTQINFGLTSILEVGKRFSIFADCLSFSSYRRTDVNQDGAVNSLDLEIAAGKFGSMTGELNWLETADVNDDGIITCLDIQLVALDN